MHSSSPARTSKLQFAADQPSTGECWIPTKKIPYIQGQRRSPSKLVAAAAAKSLQSCPTLCDHRWQPIRLQHPWDSPGKNTGVGCHVLLQCVKVKSLSCVQILVTPWTAAYQAPPSMGFSRQEYWSGVPLPSRLESNPIPTRDAQRAQAKPACTSRPHRD